MALACGNYEIIGDVLYCDGSALSWVLGLSAARITQMEQEGIIQREDADGSRLFNLSDAVQAYIDRKELNTSEADQQVKRERLAAEAEIKKAKAVISALEADELKGKMHRAEDVQAITEDFLYEIRSMLMAMPGQMAVEVSNAANAAECSAIIRTHVNQMLMDMTRYQYDPARYEERVRERLDWDIKEQETDDE